ncbi:retron St85 family effector protein [Zavarzinia sp.]|uniref:retron St85 family effector protein n=1 Tax=Zavarzinia sp. TaxID=2027920 RepID=UPI003BB67B77
MLFPEILRFAIFGFSIGLSINFLAGSIAVIIQPSLLKIAAQNMSSRVFVCGPGYSSDGIVVRDVARKELERIPNVKAIYGEEIESLFNYNKRSTDLQTLEITFAHDVDFTLLILDSPGSIAELGTFTQIDGIRERLVVLISGKFYRAESYISRGPLSLLTKLNPNSVIYFDDKNKNEMLGKIRYPLTFFKYARYLNRHDYLRNTMIRFGGNFDGYSKYIKPIRENYQMAAALISILVGDRPSYAELLLSSGLHPNQLNPALSGLYKAGRIEKIGSGRYRSVNGFKDSLLEPFSSTAISKARSKALAAA